MPCFRNPIGVDPRLFACYCGYGHDTRYSPGKEHPRLSENSVRKGLTNVQSFIIIKMTSHCAFGGRS
jgi:hypothetical protein